MGIRLSTQRIPQILLLLILQLAPGNPLNTKVVTLAAIITVIWAQIAACQDLLVRLWATTRAVQEILVLELVAFRGHLGEIAPFISREALLLIEL